MEAAGPIRRTPHHWWRTAVWSFGSAATVLFLISVPAAFERMRVPCDGPACPSGSISQAQAVALAHLGLTPSGYALYLMVLVTVLAGIHLTVAGLLLRLAGRQASAVYAAAVLAAIGVTFPQTLPALAAGDPFWSVAVDVLERLSFVVFVCWALSFPDGRFLPRWTATVAPVLLVYEAFGSAGLEPAPGGPIDLGLTVVLVGLVIGVQTHRYRRSGGPSDRSAVPERRQIRWVAGAVAAALVALVLASVAQGPLGIGPGSLADLIVQGGIVLAFLSIPVSVAAAVLRRGLWDVRASVGRAVTYGALTLGVTIAYTTLVVGVTAISSADGTGVAVTGAGLVAVVVHPGYVRLRRAMNRLLYGERDDPSAVLDELADRIASAAEPVVVLTSVAQVLVRTLRLPYARITVGGGLLRGESGTLPGSWPTSDYPLTHQGLSVGSLTVAARDGDGALEDGDERALAAVARQAAALAHAALLTHELHESRRALVAAREEERRRLRNDLHDGLGPALGAVMLKLAAAGNRLSGDPAGAGRLVEEARRQTGAVVADIRRLVYGLRPPALDELGLLAAVQSFAQGLDREGTGVSVSAGPGDEDLSGLPAAVEVAAYRIALEAVTNTVRHAAAQTCEVRIALEAGACTVTVEDDGVGMTADAAAGVGLTSMRERAAELGGSLRIDAGPSGGTRVHAFLPLPARDGEESPAEERIPWTK
ncbi:sensor histidine kinase [Planotetraspora kaengkrachanensis]|nr:sensor histidine kinase [Planotetraspora kaengkrachanensis]